MDILIPFLELVGYEVFPVSAAYVVTLINNRKSTDLGFKML